MTTHIYSDWKWGDAVDKFPYEQVINAIETHGRKPPRAYAILCPAESLVLLVGVFLSWKCTREEIKEFVPTSMPHTEDAITIFTRLIDHFT